MTGAVEWVPVPAYRRIAPRVDAYPAFVRETLIDEFAARANDFVFDAFDKGKAWLLQATKALDAARLGVGFDVEEIALRAEKFANDCVREDSLPRVERLAAFHQLTLPLGNRESTSASILARCREPKTWRKSMEKNWTRKAENKLREI